MSKEVYDTPGLNDKDRLDVLCEAVIEDHIHTLQRASTLSMTINVDGRLNNSMRCALESYKKLFGEGSSSMLLVFLTVNEPATYDEQELSQD